MKNIGSLIHRALFTVLFLAAATAAMVGYDQFMATQPVGNLELHTWIPKPQIVHLMRYHGTDGLKITQDEVFIWRNNQWIPVMRRGRV